MIAENGSQTEVVARDFEICRIFDAPRELVFNAWTKPEHLINWWGPKGFQLGVARLELRPGGTFLYSMKAATGHEMWGRFVYLGIAEPEQIVYINSFSDEEGNVMRAPFSTTWPLEVYNTLTLNEQSGKTTLTLRSGPFNATEKEQLTFQGSFRSLEQGFQGTLDQLEAYLNKIRNTTTTTTISHS
ncbi:SRPBCC domain-containing protein [Telluribacter sp.]|jgi:uncharacterized protein YndB with AHSA1/START domain|uniref:SRPBCC family protein n=1 Tax=Telluribacter sp. TaxID=1978767 RepID=UPI002E0F1636|nr:SRPBCC domain-containing protein [Telluribacter sp.]